MSRQFGLDVVKVRRQALFCLVSAAVVGCLSLWHLGPAYADSFWTDPVEVTSQTSWMSVYQDIPPQVVSDQNGEVTALWYDYEDGPARILTSSQDAGGQWSSEHELYEDQYLYSASLAAGRGGGIAAIWYAWVNDLSCEPGGYYGVFAALRPADSDSWGESTLLSSRCEDSFYPDIAVGTDGDATAIWMHSGYGVKARSFSSSTGQWQDTATVAEDAEEFDTYLEPHVVVDSDGDVTAAWHVASYDGEDYHVESAERPDGQAWQSSQLLSSSNSNASHPKLVVTPHNEVVATWLEEELVDTRIYTRVRSASRPDDSPSWQGSEFLSPAKESVSIPTYGVGDHVDIAVGATGTVAVSWRSESSDSSDSIAAAIRWSGDQDWQASESVSDFGDDGYTPRVAVLDQDIVVATWSTGFVVGGSQVSDVNARVKPRDAAWGTTERISSSSDTQSFAPDLTARGSDATSVWLVRESVSAAYVRSAQYKTLNVPSSAPDTTSNGQSGQSAGDSGQSGGGGQAAEQRSSTLTVSGKLVGRSSRRSHLLKSLRHALKRPASRKGRAKKVTLSVKVGSSRPSEVDFKVMLASQSKRCRKIRQRLRCRAPKNRPKSGILIAKGRVEFKKAGSRTVKLTLSKKKLRLLRRKLKTIPRRTQRSFVVKVLGADSESNRGSRVWTKKLN